MDGIFLGLGGWCIFLYKSDTHQPFVFVLFFAGNIARRIRRWIVPGFVGSGFQFSHIFFGLVVGQLI